MHFSNAADAPFNVLRLYEELKYTASQANVGEQRQSLATVSWTTIFTVKQ